MCHRPLYCSNNDDPQHCPNIENVVSIKNNIHNIATTLKMMSIKNDIQSIVPTLKWWALQMTHCPNIENDKY